MMPVQSLLSLFCLLMLSLFGCSISPAPQPAMALLTAMMQTFWLMANGPERS